MKKSLLLTALTFMMLYAFSQDAIKDFTQLMDNLKSGNDVKMVVHYKKCQLISDNEITEKIPDAIGGLSVDVFEYFAPNSVKNDKAFVVFSENKLIQYPKGDGYVYNYVKVKVSEDNKVKITARYIDPKTMEEVMDENFFGEINNGSNEAGVYFYAD
jgi:hypothetical protein